MARSSPKHDLGGILSGIPLIKGIHRRLQAFWHQLLCLLSRLFFNGKGHWGMPSGFYSGLLSVEGGFANGEIIFREQKHPFFTDNSLVKLCGLGQDGFQPWPLFWTKLENAVLCGRSLVPKDASGRLMAEATFSQTGDITDPAFHHFSLGRRSMIRGNATSIVSRWGGDARGNRRYGGAGYWHWLFDSVARLSLLDRFPPDTRVITPPLASWMRWFLERLDLGGRILETEATALQVENFYFSSPSSMTGCWNPHAVEFLRRSFLPFGSTPSDSRPRKFYIQREGFTRKIANERAVQEFFTSRGWALIAPEKLSIPDQIALFRDAKAIAGLHGSALTNLLWCSSGTSVLEFVPENFMAGAFEWLARINGLSHNFELCEVDQRGGATVNVGCISKHHVLE
jgi:Glycosyltransferase 61